MNMSSDENRIAEIRARAEKATPGPWTVSWSEWECDCCGEKDDCKINDPENCEYGSCITGAIVPEVKTTEYGDYTDMNDQDADFIAHAREDIPYLLERLAESQRREQAAAESLKRKCEDERAAVKCICDIETYLELGSAKYIKRVIDDWRGTQEGVNR